MTELPLTGKRIVVTRPPHAAEAFADRLRALGAEPVLLPTIRIRPPQDPGPLDRALTHLAQYDWAIFTSANAVEHVWNRLDAIDAGSRGVSWPPSAAIGPATARALRERGLHAALVPEQHIAEALFAALAQRAHLAESRIFLPQGNLARPVLADLLREAGAVVDAPIAYETVAADTDPTLLAPPIDAIAFTSPSTVQSFAAQFDDPLALLGSARIACIGPITADAARACGLPVHIMADPHTTEGLIAALRAALARHPIERTSTE